MRRGRALDDSLLEEGIYFLAEGRLKMNGDWINLGLNSVSHGESDVVFQGSAVTWNI